MGMRQFVLNLMMKALLFDPLLLAGFETGAVETVLLEPIFELHIVETPQSWPFEDRCLKARKVLTQLQGTMCRCLSLMKL